MPEEDERLISGIEADVRADDLLRKKQKIVKQILW